MALRLSTTIQNRLDSSRLGKEQANSFNDYYNIISEIKGNEPHQNISAQL
jgi:hypothetical protein